MNRNDFDCFRGLGRLCLVLAGVLFFPAPRAGAQFINRAVYLGPGEEGVRRDFDQNEEYFLNRFSYMHPPWWVENLDPFLDGVDYALGSVTNTEFTIEGTTNFTARVGRKFFFRFHELQSENQDTRFTRTALELGYDVSKSFSVFFMGEGGAEKEKDDASFGCYFHPSPSHGSRFMVTLPDIHSQRSHKGFFYPRKPVGLMWSGWFGRAGGSQLRFEIDSQLPFEMRELDDGYALEMTRNLGSMEGRLRVGRSDFLVTALDFEYTHKHFSPDAAKSPDLEHLNRKTYGVREEWWRRFPGGHEFSIGGSFLFKDELGRRPFDPGETLTTKRREWFGFARGRYRLNEWLALEPDVYAGHVQVDEFNRPWKAGNQHFHGFQGKAGAGLAFKLGQDAWLYAQPTFELDRPQFGGGNVQLRILF